MFGRMDWKLEGAPKSFKKKLKFGKIRRNNHWKVFKALFAKWNEYE